MDVDSQKDFRSTLPAPAPVAPRRGLRYALYAAAIVPLLVAVTFFGARFGGSGRTDVRHPGATAQQRGGPTDPLLRAGRGPGGRPGASVVLAEANAVVDARDGERR
ncbi:MAG: hypothetical protein V8Q54_08185 [Alistipes senegalensis]